MATNDLHERVAVLEEQYRRIDTKLEKLDTIHDDLTKYRGFMGGIMLVATAIWTFISFGKDYLLSHWK